METSLCLWWHWAGQFVEVNKWVYNRCCRAGGSSTGCFTLECDQRGILEWDIGWSCIHRKNRLGWQDWRSREQITKLGMPGFSSQRNHFISGSCVRIDPHLTPYTWVNSYGSQIKCKHKTMKVLDGSMRKFFISWRKESLSTVTQNP